MDTMLQTPEQEEQSFQELINYQKSVVIFLRHPG
jgi:hypothetical protein